MRRLTVIGLSLLGVLLSASLVYAAEGVKYDFDEVEVVYATEFTASPINVEADNWVAELAGGPDKPITVLYGIVNLKKDGQTWGAEEFIKVGGEESSVRFLVNSGIYQYYEDTNKPRSMRSFFWSAKKLVDNVVVKDFTPPIVSISVYREFDENQNIYQIMLAASNDGEKAGQAFWGTIPTENLYQANLGTLNQTGNAMAAGTGNAVEKPTDTGTGNAVEKPTDTGTGNAVEKPTDTGNGGAVEKPTDTGTGNAVEKPTDTGSGLQK
jgi:hypothetical protein